jgi:glucokinase-like ROK family protein
VQKFPATLEPALDPQRPAQPPDSAARTRRPLLFDESLLQVLAAVRTGGARSRQDVVLLTGLGRGVVAQRVDDLFAVGLLCERGTGPSTGGRPPRRFRFNPGAGHILAGLMGATSIDVAVADAAGEVLYRISQPSDIADGPDVVLGRLEALFDQLRSDSAYVGDELWGIGIGLPGPVEFTTGRPIAPPIMPGWDGYPIRERLSRRYGVPVWADNDVNVMVLGEWRFGVARDHANAVFVKIGTGIGAGLIMGGRLHRGEQGSAGDVGHIEITEDSDVVCRCGNTGCLEALVGGAALARDGEQAARDGRSPRLREILDRTGQVTAQDLAIAARHGDVASIELLQRCGRYVGKMLATVVNLMNPSLIIVGGGVAAAGDLLIATIRQGIYGRSLPLATRNLSVEPSRLGDLAGLQGAATIVLDEIFSRSHFRAWVSSGHPAALVDAMTTNHG